jgi:hypothetical protein
VALHPNFVRKIEREVAALVAAKFAGRSSPVGQGYTVASPGALDADASRVVQSVRSARARAAEIRREAAELRAVRAELDRFATRAQNAGRVFRGR